VSDSGGLRPYQTPPDFYDPDDDGINEYFNTEGQRETKAECLQNQASYKHHVSLPMSSDAHHGLLDAMADFESYLTRLAEVRARADSRDEVNLDDMVHVVAEVFKRLSD
jgi:hypothetical protein